MRIGLYNLKYAVRRLIEGVLPHMENVDPNIVSWSMLPVGAAIAACYAFGSAGQTWLYLVAIGLTGLRMYLGTLDGLMAERFEKQTPVGAIVNKVAPEFCDVMYLVVLALARPEWAVLGLGVVAVAWLTTFAGMVGLISGRPGQSIGPVGQTDRLAALMLLTLGAFCSDTYGWGIDFIWIFLMWSLFGGIVTVVLRLYPNLKPSPRAD
jgi:CDP-diacylglycerol--glycerol-3-phosphate 3-phosphatidyltransferase